jgi:tetratricopeptide (TPR) repeat protein
VRAIRKGLRVIEEVRDAAASRARARLSVWYAAVRNAQGRHREATTLCQRALTEARAAGDRETEAYASYVLDWANAELGESLLVNWPRALELYVELGDLCGQGLVLNGQGVGAQLRGDWHEAVACYQAAYDAYDRAGSFVDAARVSGNIGEVLSDQGRFDDAERHFREALRVATAAGSRFDIASILGFLGRNCARAGRFDDAFLFLVSAREEFVEGAWHRDVARIDAWRAEALSFSRDAGGALELANATLQSAKVQGGASPEAPLLERVRAESLAALGQHEEAGRALTASLGAARERGADYELALALDVLVRIPELCEYFDDVDAQLAEREALIDRLGVVIVTL